MVPTSFDESNCYIDGEESSTAAILLENEDGTQSLCTCWKLTVEELEEIIKTKRCYLVIRGTTIPASYIAVSKPFYKIDDNDNSPDFSNN